MLDRASVFSESATINIADKEVTVSNLSSSGIFTESDKCKYEGEPIKFYVAPNLIIKILKKSRKFKINERIMQFEDKNMDWKYVASLRTQPKV